jgi:2,3-bisphosphoglycerate-dependent phosphoglycerate mutase
MSTLILLRHGQSTWNQENRFTGFVDVDLTEKGRQEARAAGRALAGQPFDVIFVSLLKRAEETADLVVEVLNRQDCPRIADAALNERHYGDLQGMNKDEARRKFGIDQVHIWRRSYDVAPPGGESLKDTCDRVIPYYRSTILPRLKRGENVLIVAHGNSLRGLLKDLEGLSDEEIVKVEIPTGVPISFQVDANGNASNKIVMNPKEIL